MNGAHAPSQSTGSDLFNETTLIEIRSRVDLIELVSDFVSLKKAGRNWKGLCPFHQEKSPSFVVSEEKQIFHCFGCHEGGDIFGFLMKMEGLTFPEAVERLAERAHVALSPKAGPTLSKDEKENFFQANRVAAWHYYENLKKSPAAERARAYLKERGISEAEIEKFRLGFALPHSDELKNIFEERKVPLEAALKVGVLRQGERGYYESFRGRLIFPIFNRENKVVGLGGRILESNPEVAKYINSSDSPIYDKSATLFALPLAKEAIRRKNRVFVVEGYLDAITLHQFGFEETVAPLGTALTPKHIALLKRYTDEIIVLFDGDDAGWKAAERSLDSFLDHKITPKVLLLPPGEDPDTFLKKFGAQAFIEKSKEVRNLLSVIIDKTLAKNAKDISGKAASLESLRPYLMKIDRPLERNLHIRRIAQGLDVPESWIFEELGLSPLKTPVKSGEKGQTKTAASAEELLLEIFIKFEGLRAKLIDKIQPDELFNEQARGLAVFLWKEVGLSACSVGELLPKVQDTQHQALLTELALKETAIETETASAIAADCVEKIKMDALKRKLGDLSLKIKNAEAHHQTDQVSVLLKEKQNILANLNAAKT